MQERESEKGGIQIVMIKPRHGKNRNQAGDPGGRKTLLGARGKELFYESNMREKESKWASPIRMHVCEDRENEPDKKETDIRKKEKRRKEKREGLD